MKILLILIVLIGVAVGGYFVYNGLPFSQFGSHVNEFSDKAEKEANSLKDWTLKNTKDAKDKTQQKADQLSETAKIYYASGKQYLLSGSEVFVLSGKQYVQDKTEEAKKWLENEIQEQAKETIHSLFTGK